MRRAPLTIVLLLGACAPAMQGPDGPAQERAATPSSKPEPREPVVDAPAVVDRPCESMTRTECMRSTECTLEQEVERSDRYRCRPSLAPCEVGLAQAAFWGSGAEGVSRSREQQAECSARPGCAFVDGGCYCPCRGMGQTAVPDGDEAVDCKCECASGPPPTCRAEQ
jgi:hypothetical protein